MAQESSPEVAAAGEVPRCGAMSTSSKLLLWSSADEDDDEDDPADDDGDLESVYDIAHSLDQSPTPTFATSSLMQISSSSPKSGLHTVDRTTQCLKSPDSRWLSGGTHGSSPLPIASHIVDSASLSVISLARRTARIIQIRSRCSEKVLLRLRLDRPPPPLRLPPPHTSKRRC